MRQSQAPALPSTLTGSLAAFFLMLCAGTLFMLTVPPPAPGHAQTLTPATLAQPYAKLCFAPEWWLVEGFLNDHGHPAQLRETLREANTVFCGPDTPATLTPSAMAGRQYDAFLTLKRLMEEIANLSPDSETAAAASRVQALRWLVVSLSAPAR